MFAANVKKILQNPDFFVSKLWTGRLYLDITEPVRSMPKGWNKLMRIGESSQVVLNVDSNAHISIWGHVTNKTGKILEEMLVNSGWWWKMWAKHLLSLQEVPKFDITLTKNLEPGRLKDWRVSDQPTFSDIG